MRFSFIATAALSIASVASAATISPRAISGAEVSAQLKALTQKTESNSAAIKDIVPALLFTQFGPAIKGLQQFNTLLQGDVQALGNPYDIKVSEEGQKNICAAYKTFKIQFQQTLSLLIGKSGLLESTPFTAPVSVVLTQTEEALDAYSFGIIDITPTCGDGPSNDKKNLDETLNSAICTYSLLGGVGGLTC